MPPRINSILERLSQDIASGLTKETTEQVCRQVGYTWRRPILDPATCSCSRFSTATPPVSTLSTSAAGPSPTATAARFPQVALSPYPRIDARVGPLDRVRDLDWRKQARGCAPIFAGRIALLRVTSHASHRPISEHPGHAGSIRHGHGARNPGQPPCPRLCAAGRESRPKQEASREPRPGPRNPRKNQESCPFSGRFSADRPGRGEVTRALTID